MSAFAPRSLPYNDLLARLRGRPDSTQSKRSNGNAQSRKKRKRARRLLARAASEQHHIRPLTTSLMSSLTGVLSFLWRERVGWWSWEARKARVEGAAAAARRRRQPRLASAGDTGAQGWAQHRNGFQNDRWRYRRIQNGMSKGMCEDPIARSLALELVLFDSWASRGAGGLSGQDQTALRRPRGQRPCSLRPKKGPKAKQNTLHQCY
jgi:hypothetical protein